MRLLQTVLNYLLQRIDEELKPGMVHAAAVYVCSLRFNEQLPRLKLNHRSTDSKRVTSPYFI